ARVEYQPNLNHPTQPIALGVIAEEVSEAGRTIVIVGRMPIAPPAEFQLEGEWGPFREGVVGWVEIFHKGIRESLKNISPHAYVWSVIPTGMGLSARPYHPSPTRPA